MVFDKVQHVGPRDPGWEALGTKYKPDEWQATFRATLETWRKMMRTQPDERYHTGEPLSRAFWRTVQVDLKQNSPDGPRQMDSQDWEDLVALETEEGLEEFLARVKSNFRRAFRQLRLIEQFNRRFYVTVNGYIGLGPPGLDVGDSICLLELGQVPYALRDAGPRKRTYLGECYVHRIMDGELVEVEGSLWNSWEEFAIE